jgi:hypothetical protein
MVFESVRGYVQLASGLTELTRARATEAAHGLLSLQGAGMESSGKLAGQVSALAEELLVAATTNRHNLTALVRSEVDAAVNRLGLVSTDKLAESQAEVAGLRAELAALRSASSRATTTKTAAKKTAAKETAAKKTAAKKTAAKKTAAKKTAAKKTAAKKTAAKKTATTGAAAKPVSTATTTQASAIAPDRKPADA